MTRSLFALLAALALVAAACGGDDESASDATSPDSSTSSSTTADGTAPDGSTTTTDPGSSPSATWDRCENPDGFAISHPADWAVNDGSVTTACSLFDPEPFTVPEATDERVAAISAHVDDVAFHDVAAPGDETDRAITAVDGHQAVRTVGPAGELYGEDTEATRYAIDLALGVDDGPGTLIVDVVDLEGVDYSAAVTVMDRMVRSIDLTVADEAPEDVVARYEGAAPFSASLTFQEDDPCLTAPTQGEPRTECFTVPSADALRFADYSGDLFSAFGGVTGAEVFRVDVRTSDGRVSYLPTGTSVGDARGWIVPVGGDSIESIEWFAADGTALGTRVLDEESGLEPIAEFQSTPVGSDTFPGTGEPALLRDVRVAGHEGFDRVVFEFGTSGDGPTYEIESVDEVRSTSGETVSVDGDTIYRVIMSPASAVDLSGQEPVVTYDGPEEIAPTATGVVRDVVLVEDFESTMTWAIGVDGAAEIAATTIDDPTRLVIDVAA